MTALEDVPVYMYETRKDGVYVNIISESSTALPVKGGQVRIDQTADYAHTGVAEFVIGSAPKGAWALAVHQPEWASSFVVKVNGKEVKAAVKDGYIRVRRAWKAGDRLTLEFPYEIRTLERECASHMKYFSDNRKELGEAVAAVVAEMDEKEKQKTEQICIF